MDTHKMRLVVASGNPGKFTEIVALLEGVDVLLVPLDRVGPVAVPPEGGDSFQENARLKAETVAWATGLLALADDSGLEVDALGGMPGVLSARYGGMQKTDEERNHLLLDNLRRVPWERRTARFRCVVAIAEPAGPMHIVEGTCEGRIALAPRGVHGFGYDPVFEIPALGRTFAEIGPELKNRLSHRGQAMRHARAVLQTLVSRREF
jgi:XTP/dITP diphosphohydrolase